jgi:ligand-binding sensor domain-containing protein/anti-sigma regulatory factor (Ser/Thr protein kinase)
MGRHGILLAAVALASCARGEQLAIRNYTTAEGLPADRVDGIVADSRGFLWFATPEGLSRFDGYRITTFGTADGLPHRAAQAFLETRAGSYLVGTPRGLAVFRPGVNGNRFQSYKLAEDAWSNDVGVLVETPSGKIWCGTGNGLFEVLSGPRFRRQTLPPPTSGWDRMAVSDIVEDGEGKLWLATTTGIYVLGKDGATLCHLAGKDGLLNEWTNGLLLDKKGRLWAATRNGLAKMRGVKGAECCGVERLITEKDGLAANNVYSLAEGRDGTIWAGTASGLSKLAPNEADGAPHLENLTRAQGLSDRQIDSLAVDTTGNIWAGTEGAGVMRIQLGGFSTFHEQDGLGEDRIWSVLTDREGSLLAVAHAPMGWSLNLFNGVRFKTMLPKVFSDHAAWGHRIVLQSRTGDWWAATTKGLCRYAAVDASGLDGKRPISCYAQDTQVFQVFEDSRGGIWASAQSPRGDRLLRWDAVTRDVTQFEQGPSHAPLLVSAFAEDHDGNIWMGLWVGRDLYRYDGKQFTRYGEKEGVPQGTDFALLVDRRGRLWMGTSNGLALVEKPGSERFSVRTYSAEKGLASNRIYCLVEDDLGRIYAGTQKGVDRLDPETGNIKHFSTSDGLAHGELNTATKDSAGNLWFATTQGLSRLRPRRDEKPSLPSVLITSLRVGRERYPVSKAGETRVTGLELRPGENQIQVEFAGHNDEPEESLRYTYKLGGGNADWLTPGRDHEANYPGLAPGGYNFLVKAVNSSGDSGEPASIEFRVLPPFWQRWWFEGLLLAAVGVVIYTMHRYRVAQLLRVERIRMAIATDLHDDIGATLSQIAILSEVARVGGEGAPGAKDEPLGKIAALSRELVDTMSDIVWSIRPEPDGTASLVRRMREFALDVLASRDIAFELRAPGEEAVLGLQARRQLLLIYKECIHNAVRHSGCTWTIAELKMRDGEAVLRVEDNGRGFDPGAPPQGRGGTGIAGMKRRAQSVGGSVEVQSVPGGGCTVIARIPV